MKKYIIYVLILAILVGGYGFYEYNRAPDNVSHLKTDFKIEATQLFTDFEEDETAANTKYLDKVIEVNGTITNISKQDNGTKSITLESDNMIFGVIGELDPLSNTSLKDLKKGDQITLKGICSGMLSDVVLVRCIIL